MTWFAMRNLVADDDDVIEESNKNTHHKLYLRYFNKC